MILVAGWQAASTKGTPVARVQIEDFVTRVTFDQAFPGRQRFHHDLLWSVGLMIPIRGR